MLCSTGDGCREVIVAATRKLARLRSIVRPDLAVVGIDLASAKQAAVVTDHDSITLGRRMFIGDPWVVDEILDWALPIALEAGFAGIVVGCEPNRHRWKPVLEAGPGSRRRGGVREPDAGASGTEEEDFTRDRSDFKDSTIIARRVADRHCYVPYALDGEWCRLRHSGARRNRRGRCRCECEERSGARAHRPNGPAARRSSGARGCCRCTRGLRACAYR